MPGGTLELEVQNLPGFQEEEYMLPESMLKSRVDLFYIVGYTVTEDYFWAHQGKQRGEMLEKFIGKHKSIEREVARIISPQDAPETKMRKLYERAQQLRFLTYEHSKSEKEEKAENLKDNENVEDVLKRGYARGNEVNMFFTALARAAGFEANLAALAQRDARMFQTLVLDPSQLTAMVVEVRAGSSLDYFDPATRYCPFNLLPWEETSTEGIRLDKNGGAFVSTPVPKSADAVTERTAKFDLSEDGSLEGVVHVTYSGQPALQRRLENREADEAGRRKELEDEVKGWLPSGASVELKSAGNWEISNWSLDAEFAVKVPPFGTSTGRRLLLPLAIFQAGGTYPFRNAKRIHSIYFHYPYQEVDHISVKLPKGYDVESLPAPRSVEKGFGRYEITRRSEGNVLKLERSLVMESFTFPVQSYSALRIFFDGVRAGDEEQVVLKTVQMARQN